MLDILTLVFVNVLVALSSLCLTKKFFSRYDNVDFILTWFTLFFAQIIIVELFLGVIGQLYLLNIILLHLIICLIICFLFLNKKQKVIFPRIDLSFIFNNKILLFIIAIFLGFFFIKLWINLINPPICPDSLQYHLTFPATWIRNGNLNNPIVIFGSRPTSAEVTALTYYPINAELFFFWLMLPLKNAFLADAGQVPFYFIGILAIYSILKKFLIKKETAILIGILWALIPNLFKQIRTGSQLDVICAALFLLVLNNLLILHKKLTFKNAIIFGISLGLFIGTKALNIYWSLALLPLFVYYMYRQINKNTMKYMLSILAVIFLIAFLFGGFTYLRTFIMTGNPFYPVTFNFIGKTIFPGIIDKESFSKIFVPWKEFSLRNMFFGEGLGLQFIAFIFPGSIVPLLFSKLIKNKFKGLFNHILIFFIPVSMFWMYFFCIKAYWIRYLFPILGIGFICAVIFLDKFNWGKKYITIFGFLCILSSAAELAHRTELIISLIFSFLLFFILLIFRKYIINYSKKILSLRTLLIIIIIFSALLYFLNEKYNKEEYTRYPLLFKGKEAGERDIAFAWKCLNENTGSGKRIAYTGRSEFYPLFGTGLKNHIYYVSVSDKPSLPHYYLDGLYRKEKEFNSWIENLIKQKINYLFVALPYPINNESNNPKDFPIEDKWAQDNPEIFKLIFSNSKARVYSFGK